jgi:hypothetical protein
MSESGYFFLGDLLGFSKLITNLGPEAADERVHSWTDLLDEVSRTAGVSRMQLISDTVFAATDATEVGLERLVRFSRIVLELGVARSLPVRGAISFGTFTWGRLTHGVAVVQCHELERRQQWIGVACSSGLPHVTSQWDINKLVCYPAPMASGPIQLRPIVAWTIPAFDVLTKALTNRGLTRDGEALSWEFANKVSNTSQLRMYLRFLDQTRNSPSAFHGFHPLQVIEQHFVNAI